MSTIFESAEVPVNLPSESAPVTGEFSRATVEALGSNVRMTDSDEENNLQLFCYVQCDESDHQNLQQCRGVVFSGDQIVMKAFPYTIECVHTAMDMLRETLVPSVLRECVLFDSHEGTLVRMFYHKKWYMCTHRKLDAFRSKWASRESFGHSFKRSLETEVEVNEALRSSLPDGDEDVIERFQTTLDPAKQYMFLVRNNGDNRIVCQAPDRPTLYHVGTFVDGELVMTEDVGVPHPMRHTFDSLDSIYKYVDGLNPRDLQGVIIFAPDNKQYKVVKASYQELFEARGNEPSIKFQYLKMRMNRTGVDKLFYLYPEHAETFHEYEDAIYEICKSIYKAYVLRYIKKRFVTQPKEEFSVMRQCHAWHEENRKEHRVTMDRVIEKMNTMSPTAINRMIRRFKTEDVVKTKTEAKAKTEARSNTVSNVGGVDGHLVIDDDEPCLGVAAVEIESDQTRVLSESH